jgi:Fe-S-cluster containining protein
MEKELFYVDGLKFSCKQCSSCCRYDQGFVFLSQKDLKKLSSALKTDENSVISAYCRWVTGRKGDTVLSLKEKSNKDCVLWDSGCTVYTARPLQCVTFPFWESIIASKQCWEIAAASCPGINSGELHTKAEIEKKSALYSSELIISKERFKKITGRD